MESTFPRLLLQHAAQRPGAAAMREKEYGIWQALTWAELAQMVEHLACGLREAGLLLPADEAGLFAYAKGLAHWQRETRFCAYCGSPLQLVSSGHRAQG